MAQQDLQHSLITLAQQLHSTDVIPCRYYFMDSLGNTAILGEESTLVGAPTALRVEADPDQRLATYAHTKLPMVIQQDSAGRVAAWHNMDSMRMVAQQRPEIWPNTDSFLGDLIY